MYLKLFDVLFLYVYCIRFSELTNFIYLHNENTPIVINSLLNECNLIRKCYLCQPYNVIITMSIQLNNKVETINILKEVFFLWMIADI